VDSHVELFSSYHSSRLTKDQYICVWEAARATSAAPGFFDPVAVGPYQIKYIDGGMGANNPVHYTVQVAKDIWPEVNIACLVSIGSGTARIRSVPTQLLDMTKYLVAIATDTEETAETFARSNRDMAVADRYFRFNVNHGMEHIGSDEWSAVENIVSFTKRYCQAVVTESSIERCAEKLRRNTRFIPEVPGIEVIETSSPQIRVSDQPLFAQPQGRTPSIVADSGPSTGPDGQDLSHATHTGPESFEEEDILMKDIAECILTDIEMRFLILTAYDKIGDLRLKKNLVILLEDFAQRLSIEKLFGYLPNFVL
jgi:Patatin-like phospholipase